MTIAEYLLLAWVASVVLAALLTAHWFKHTLAP